MPTTIEQLYKFYQYYPNIQTDSRKIEKGDIYFALRGPNFNGNSFALDALKKGAAHVVVDEDLGGADSRIFYVEDVLKTLQALAKFHRNTFNIPFLAITGSNGKTTTKELIYAVLNTHIKTYTTEGNLNNHIGIPLTLLKVKRDAEIAVIEMGANHQKEIEGYCKYTQPTHGLITNCGKAHLEGFGGEEGVRKGKGELYTHLRIYNGTAFAFNDYDYLHQMIDGVENIVWYGTKNGTVIGDVISSEPFLSVSFQVNNQFYKVNSQLVGAYNLPNILSAIAIGVHFEVPIEKIINAIEQYSPSNSRSQLVNWGDNKIILDAYNANPTSMKAAIENFANMNVGPKIIMLGGMMELGEESIAEHRAVIQLLKQYTWEKVVLVGGDFRKITHPYTFFDTAVEAKAWLLQQHYNNAYLLIKGSRSFKMETIIQ